MPDLFQQASAWLEANRKAFLASAKTYIRGNQSVVVQATKGKTEFEVDSGGGFAENVQAWDFLITAADLTFGGGPVTPQKGDLIQEASGSNIYTYEVLAPGGAPVYRFSDPYRVTLRIHTKLIGQA